MNACKEYDHGPRLLHFPSSFQDVPKECRDVFGVISILLVLRHSVSDEERPLGKELGKYT